MCQLFPISESMHNGNPIYKVCDRLSMSHTSDLEIYRPQIYPNMWHSLCTIHITDGNLYWEWCIIFFFSSVFELFSAHCV